MQKKRQEKESSCEVGFVESRNKENACFRFFYIISFKGNDFEKMKVKKIDYIW